MTAPRKKGGCLALPTECVRDNVCSASIPRACIPAHLVETMVDKKS